MLVVFGGLPGTGKSTLGAGLARRLRATYLRVDALEAGLIAAGLVPDQQSVGATGYLLAHRVADSCLRVGLDVVVDAVNPVEPARAGWRQLAADTGVPLTFVEVVCSDVARHRQQVEGRRSDLPGWDVPDWEAVRTRDYETWTDERIVVDNIGDPAAHIERIFAALPDSGR